MSTTMQVFSLGTPLILSYTTRDKNGALVDVTGVTFTVAVQGGLPVTFTGTSSGPGTGTFTYPPNFTPSTPGLYAVRAISNGPASEAEKLVLVTSLFG